MHPIRHDPNSVHVIPVIKVRMRRTPLILIGLAFAVTQSSAAFDLTNILKKPEVLLPMITGGGLAAVCNQVFKGRDGQAAATAVCAVAGVLVGQKIKEALNEREQEQLAQVTNQTLNTGKRQTVKTAEGTTITTELVKPTAIAPSKADSAAPSKADRKRDAKRAQDAAASTPATANAAPVEIAAADGTCGMVKQTVITAKNERVEDTVNVCKKEGVWVAA